MIFSRLENIGKEKRDNPKVVSLLFDSLKPLKTFFLSSSVSNVLMDNFYNAAGQKVRKKVYEMTAPPSGIIKDVEYLDGFQYVGGVLNFFPTAEGYVSVTESNSLNNPFLFNYVYNYTDHLGNIRFSYTKDPVSGVLTKMEENHYYPFGLKYGMYSGISMNYQLVDNLPGTEPEARPTYVYKTDYQYKYNGKEFQDELGLNLYDYGARNYDPALGRWSVIDPQAHLYFSQSPYNYVGNNPIIRIDPDGMIWDDPLEALKLMNSISNKINSLSKDNISLNKDIDDIKNNDKLSEEEKQKQIDKKQNKIDDNQKRQANLSQSIDNIMELGWDQNNTYAFSTNTMHSDKAGVRKGSDGIIYIEGKDNEVLIHEMSHARDYSDHPNSFVFDKDQNNYLGSKKPNVSKQTEIKAYKAGYSYSGNFPRGLGVKTIDDINVHSVGNITDSKGEYVYPVIKQMSDNMKKSKK